MAYAYGYQMIESNEVKPRTCGLAPCVDFPRLLTMLDASFKKRKKNFNFFLTFFLLSSLYEITDALWIRINHLQTGVRYI